MRSEIKKKMKIKNGVKLLVISERNVQTIYLCNVHYL